jgi:aminoglycoside 3-N-acetyltransferase
MSAINYMLYRIARKWLRDEQRMRLKGQILVSKTKMSRALKIFYGSFDASELQKHIQSKIGNDYEILMVHTSFDGLLPFYTGTIADLLLMLQNLCGVEKTLAMPAFSFQLPKKNDPEKQCELLEFNVKRTPSHMGLLNEFFRRSNNVYRSMHPTASVCARGPLAEELTKNHHLSLTEYGEETPFGKMAKINTTILGLGVRYFRSLTQVHTGESMLGDRYPLKLQKASNTIRIVNEKGKVSYYENTFYKDPRTSNRGHDVILPYMKKDEFEEWKFHGINLYRAKANAITRAVLDAAKDGKTIYDH